MHLLECASHEKNITFQKKRILLEYSLKHMSQHVLTLLGIKKAQNIIPSFQENVQCCFFCWVFKLSNLLLFAIMGSNSLHPQKWSRGAWNKLPNLTMQVIILHFWCCCHFCWKITKTNVPCLQEKLKMLLQATVLRFEAQVTHYAEIASDDFTQP